MNWKLAFTIAMTHLLTKKKQTVVAMLGVTFGISMFIIMISFMTGVNDFTEDMAMDNTPHLHLYKAIEIEDKKITALNQTIAEDEWYVVEHQKPKNELSKIKNGFNLMQRIEAMPGVRGIAPQVSTQVFYNNGPIQIPGNIYGVDVQKQIDLFDLDKKMDAGELTDLLKGSNVIVMGKGLAEKMGIHVGDRVSITTPEGNNLNLKVVGIFSFGVAALDQTQSYATLATVQKILQKDPSYVTDLNVKMYDVTTSAAFGERLSRQVKDVKIEDWEAANQSLLAGEQIRNIMTFVVCFTLLVVAGFGIYNIMNMNIINKMKDIAILKATGFQGSDVTLIFMIESVSIGIAGAFLGLVIGFFFSYLLSQTPFPAGEFFRIDTFPVNFNPVHYTIGVFFGFLTTLMAGWFPARKASKIDPVVIIRG
ncbi:MAG: ABC transporter permease [Cyclobacteriaceae bacterium]